MPVLYPVVRPQMRLLLSIHLPRELMAPKHVGGGEGGALRAVAGRCIPFKQFLVVEADRERLRGLKAVLKSSPGSVACRAGQYQQGPT